MIASLNGSAAIAAASFSILLAWHARRSWSECVHQKCSLFRKSSHRTRRLQKIYRCLGSLFALALIGSDRVVTVVFFAMITGRLWYLLFKSMFTTCLVKVWHNSITPFPFKSAVPHNARKESSIARQVFKRGPLVPTESFGGNLKLSVIRSAILANSWLSLETIFKALNGRNNVCFSF